MPKIVQERLRKARDSAILAVEVYNKPAVTFKSGCYISLMVIAWTSLFHAVFFKRKVKPYYREDNGRYQRIDDDYKHWELDECLRQYFTTDTGNPVRKNLEFFRLLRNKIEHRSLRELDAPIFGECQALLLNFDDMLEKEFGLKYRIRECLSFAIQLYPTTQNLGQAVQRNRSLKAAMNFIEHYRSTITTEVYQSGQFAFKAFLIQVANHQSQDALPIQFVHWDRLTEAEKESVVGLAALVKPTRPTVANADTMRPADVIARVKRVLGDSTVQRGGKPIPKYNSDWHKRCWRRFNVRPVGGSPNPNQTDARYCIYDRRHNDYSYTEAWVQLLIEKFRDEAEYQALYLRVLP